MSKYKYIGCLDFEANCIENGVIYPQEIIEFPVVIYDVEKDTIDRSKDFHYYCTPHVPLTPFCTTLTGIRQETVNNGLDFNTVLDLYSEWMIVNGFNNNNFIITSCGSWDLKTAMPAHCKYLGIEQKSWFKKWCNVKFSHTFFTKEKIHGMDNLLKTYGLEFDGRPHSGIDDAYNLARVVQQMYKKGYYIAENDNLKN